MRDASKKIIINGDDFGLSTDCNTAIVAAHEHGVISSTSLMIGGDAAQEAISLARQHPNLAIGLHVAFSDTRPVLPPEQIPLLVQSDGYFPSDDCMHRSALLSKEGRRQIKAEIAAQFAAFHATNLSWDHVNTHRHVHRHPAIGYMIFHEAAKWNVNTTRIPWDPPSDPLRHMRVICLRQLAAVFKLRAPDRSIGRHWTIEIVTELLATLPSGVTELYFHPGNHLFPEDISILLDARVKAAMNGIALSGIRSALCPAYFLLPSKTIPI